MLELPPTLVRRPGNFSGLVSVDDELVRGQVPERGVGSISVVVAPPFLDAIAGVGQRQEP